MVVEKDPEFREHLAMRLKSAGLNIYEAGSLCKAEKYIQENELDGVVLGLSGFGRSSLNLMEMISTIAPELKVVLINRHNKISLSIEAMNLGACAEISVPVDIAALVKTLHRICMASTDIKQQKRPTNLDGGKHEKF
ncbi:response regulator [Maridesulfovibrio zosterae]|uniref:response regulator n=1 Tax=Maridesulfovibrio zosterae TaxID=82171 RepID=UPI00040CCF1C|nr:response regulator [Maridesulfovibrio zosterae]